MKKLINHATVVVFAAAFVACGGGAAVEEEPPNDDMGPDPSEEAGDGGEDAGTEEASE